MIFGKLSGWHPKSLKTVTNIVNMPNNNSKIKSILQLYDAIPEHERIIVDVLRAIVAEQMPLCP